MLFVRHGRVHNPSGVIYGRMPRMRLSEQGIEEVQRTARLLADFRIAAIYTSPLLRARQTARILARGHPGAPIRRSAWLIEVLTSWEGETRSAEQESPRFSYYDPPRGEADDTIQSVFDRMDRALRMVATRHPGETTICVSHGDPIKILTIGYLGKELNFEEVRAPDPPEASVVAFHFVERQALPVIDLWIPRAFIRPRPLSALGQAVPPSLLASGSR